MATLPPTYCQTCDYNRHTCGGCGESVEHGQGCCEACAAKHGLVSVLPSLLQANALRDIHLERKSQDAKWGSQRENPALLWSAILGEETGEVAKAVLENGPGLRAELVQVAAVAVAWIEALDYSS